MEIAALNLAVNSDSVKQASVELKQFGKQASAAERAAERWGTSTTAAARSTDDFSRRVQGTIKSLEFERAQLTRTAAEQAKYSALRRAGVSAASAEGQAIAASVAALQAQRAALQTTAVAAKETGAAFSQMRGFIGAFAGVSGASAILKAADAFTALTNAIKVSGAEGAALSYIQERLFAAANKNGVAIDALGMLYSRTAIAGKELGVGQETLLEFVDGVTAALRVQGGSTEAAKGALLQLSQALGAGVVRAEEFNSILEGALPIAQAAARGMDGMGGSVAKLRTAILAGSVTSKEFFDATMRGFGETKKQAESARLTIGQSMTALSNSFIDYVGQVDKASGASGALAKAIKGVSDAIDEAGKTAAAGDGGMFDLSKAIETDIRDLKAIVGALDDAYNFAMTWARKIGTAISDGMDTIAAESARGSAAIITAFTNFPSELGKLFVDAWNAAKKATIEGINDLTGWLAAHAPAWMKFTGTNLQFTPTPGGGANPAGFDANVAAAGDAAATRVRDAQAARRMREQQAGFEREENRSRLGGMPVSGPLGLGVGGTAAAGKGGAKSDPYAKAIESAREYIATKKVETEAVGMAGEAAARMKHEQELLNKVQGDGKTASAAQRVEIANLAQQMAAADAALDKAKFMDDASTKADEFIATQQIERDTLWMSAEAADAYRIAQTYLNDAKAKGIELSTAEKAALQDLAAQQAAASEKTREAKELYDLAKTSFTGFISDIRTGLMEGKSVWETFGNAATNALDKIASKLLDMAAQKLFESAFPKSGGGGIGGILFDLLGSAIGGAAGGISAGPAPVGGYGGYTGYASTLPGFANGAAFRAGNVIPFAAGGVVSRPTMFPMANGAGLMGEAGPEAIMPLRRGPGGRLGVSMHGGGSSGQQKTERVEIVLISDMLDARIAQGADVRIVRAAPSIEGRAVKTANKAVPSMVAQDHRTSGGDYRTRTA